MPTAAVQYLHYITRYSRLEYYLYSIIICENGTYTRDVSDTRDNEHHENRYTPVLDLFKMEVLKGHTSNLNRLAILIEKADTNKLTNKKSEWGRNKLIRLRVNTDLV